MIALVQRVTEASVTVDDPPYHAAIDGGLCVLLGVENGDTPAEAEWVARKLANLRIFRDDDDKMNRSVSDVDGAILLVSQFTLAGNCERGNRPSFANAAAPDVGNALYELVANQLRTTHSIPVETGCFGADMRVALVNDGPVTLIIRRDPPVSSGA